MSHLSIYSPQDWLALAEKSEYKAAALAEMTNASPTDLNRQIRRVFGRSTQDWLDEVRLCKAAELLKLIRRVKEVADLLKFKSIFHFSRKFKDHYGACPTGFLAELDRKAALNAPPEKAPRQKPRPEPLSPASTAIQVRR